MLKNSFYSKLVLILSLFFLSSCVRCLLDIPSSKEVSIFIPPQRHISNADLYQTVESLALTKGYQKEEITRPNPSTIKFGDFVVKSIQNNSGQKVLLKAYGSYSAYCTYREPDRRIVSFLPELNENIMQKIKFKPIN